MDPTGPDELEAAEETSRRRLARWLAEGEHDFETLREALGVGARELERELRHVARSARREARRLRVTPPRCLACGFAFPGRAERHLHPPGRCPRCRGQRIAPPRFRLERTGGG
ncbi:MAG: transcriptional regulator [Myxococcota bacterium]|nr:transcriptional regulator [Myxococcota bacterium]